MVVSRILVLVINMALVLARDTSKVFKIGLDELDRMVGNNELDQLEVVLRTEGTLAVSGLSQEYVAAVRDLRLLAPRCLSDEGLPEFELPDGSLRTTFATSTEEQHQYPGCIRGQSEVISRTFDSVYTVVDRLVTKGGIQILNDII